MKCFYCFVGGICVAFTISAFITENPIVIRCAMLASLFSVLVYFITGSRPPILIALLALSASPNLRADEIFLKELPAISELPQVALAWNPTPNIDGTMIFGGIFPDYPLIRHWDAGTNTEIAINDVAGGYPWYFVAIAYDVDYVTVGTNQIRRLRDSGGGDHVARYIDCPVDSPQLLLINGNWLVAAQSSSVGFLETSSDLRSWDVIGPVESGTPTVYSGPATNTAQFFRITNEL